MSLLCETVNNLVDIIRLVARLFQQVRYSHDIIILLQPCVVNFVIFLLNHDCIKLVRTTLYAIKLVTSCKQLVPNLLQQLGTSSANTTCRQLVNRFVTTCCRPFKNSLIIHEENTKKNHKRVVSLYVDKDFPSFT
jgi:hypothetical protein